MEGNPNTCSREKAKREKERENHSGGARPPNLMNISLLGLTSLPFLLMSRESCPCSKRPCSMRVHATNKGCSQTTIEHARKQDKAKNMLEKAIKHKIKQEHARKLNRCRLLRGPGGIYN